MSDFLPLPLPSGGELRVVPNTDFVEDDAYVNPETVVGLIYNPVTNVLIALTTSGRNRLIDRGNKRFHLDLVRRDRLGR